MRKHRLVGCCMVVAVAMAGVVGAAVERRGQGVVFTLDRPGAGSVMVTGSWVGWRNARTNPNADLGDLQLERGPDGVWRREFPTFPAEAVQYRFIVDGEWMSDPENPEGVRNEHNSINSLVLPVAAAALPEVVPPLPTGAASLRLGVVDSLRKVAAGRCLVALRRDGSTHIVATSREGELALDGIAPGEYTATVMRTAYESSRPVVVTAAAASERIQVALAPQQGSKLTFHFWQSSPRRRLSDTTPARVRVFGEFNRWQPGESTELADPDGDGVWSGTVDVGEGVRESDYLFWVATTDEAGEPTTATGPDPDSDDATPSIAADSHFAIPPRDRPLVTIASARPTPDGQVEVLFTLVQDPAGTRLESTVNGITRRHELAEATLVDGTAGWRRLVIPDLPEGEASVLVRAIAPDGRAGSDGTAVWRQPAPPADMAAWTKRWTDASPSPVEGPPSWLADAAIYHLLVRSFVDSDRDGIGDFRGLAQRLDHIAGMGFNTIKLMPVWDGPSNHGYTPTSLWRVEQEYGTDDDFRALVEACHARGLRVVLDYNDTATFTGHPLMGPAVREADHPLRDWIFWLGRDRYQSYTLTADVSNGGWPQFNYHNPAVRESMTMMLGHWASYGVDGFRFDSAERLQPPPHWDWWRVVRRELKAQYPDTYLLGEVYNAREAAWFDGRLDGAYDTVFNDSLRDVARGTRAAADLGRVLEESAAIDPGNTRFLRYLANHDGDRALTQFGGDKARWRLATAALLTLPGVPAWWYGDEFGMPGRGISTENSSREPIAWDTGDREMAAWVEKLGRLRASDATLRNAGSCEVLPTPRPERVLIIRRASREQPPTRDYTLLFHFAGAGASAAPPISGRLEVANAEVVVSTPGANAGPDPAGGTGWLLPPNSMLVLAHKAD